MPQAVVAVQAFIYGVVGTSAAAVGFSSATAASIAAGAVGIATATAKVALLAGLNAVVANQNRPRPQGGLINLTINPDEPRRLQIGKRINGGVLSDWYVGGSKNGELFMVVYLGEGPMGRITKVFGGGREVYTTPITHGVRTEIPEYRSVGDRIPGRLWVTYYDGRPGQTADSYLVGKGLGWTADHVGTGCAYAIIEAWWDSDNQTTPPSISFEIEGAKLYDRRKDSTAGGSGSHRANDPATWELSSNPAVALDHYLLGRYVGAVKTFGVGLEAEDVPYAPFAALANLCDEDVPRKVSGTLKRYEANGFLFADRTYADTIRDLCRAMNARPADFGGRIGIISGEEKTPVMTIADADVIDSVQESYTPKRSWADLVSVVRGTYQNPAQNYQAGEYPRVEDAAWTAADGGSPKEATLDLEMETDVERAQRLARLFALRERRQAKLAGTYGLRTIELEQGDWFIRAGGIFGEGKTFEVIDRVLDPRTMNVTLTAFEVDPADSAWNEDDAQDAPPAPVASTDELQPMEVPVLTVTGVTLSGTSAELPAIKVEWAEPDDIRVQQILIEAVPAAGGVPTSAQVDWATGQVVFTSGITDDTDYLVRAKFVGDFIPSAWTSNIAVTTLGDYSVGVASSVPWSGVTGAGRPDDNADVTAANTAAAITGQGPGATAAAGDVLNSFTLLRMNAGMARNANFAEPFSGTARPPGWSEWVNGQGTFGTLTQLAGSGYKRTVAAGVETDGLLQYVPAVGGQAYIIAGEARRSSGSFAPTGIYVSWRNGSGTELGIATIQFGAESDTTGIASATPDGFHRWEKLVTAPAGTESAILHAINVGWFFGSVASGTGIEWKLCDLIPISLVSQLRADRTEFNTAAALAGQGNLATSNLTRGTTAARPTATGSGSLYSNTTTGTVQLDTAAGVWTDIASLSTAVASRGRIIGPGAVSFSANSAWQVAAQVDVTDVPAGALIQVTYTDVIGQSLTGLPGGGYQWRVTEAPTASPATKTVLKSGTFTVSGDDPPIIDALTQPSGALVAVTNTGSVRYTIEVQKTSGTGTVGLQLSSNIIINPS